MTRSPGSVSLATRLVLLFVLGSAAIMAAAGYALYHALKMQLEAKDAAELGGRTELSNLLLVCSFHHRLVHEHGWRIDLERDGTVHWLKPSGVRYRAGPSPWLDVEEPMPMTSVG